MTTFVLKIIALVSMVTDHTGVLLQSGDYSGLAFTMRLIGRSAFPLYAFLIGEGCRHSRNLEKYLARLLCFAVISEIPFDLFQSNVGKPGNVPATFLDFSYQNVFFTLFLGALAIYIYVKCKEKANLSSMAAVLPGALGCLAAAFLAYCLKTDYSYPGVVFTYAVFVAGDLFRDGNEAGRKIAAALTMILGLMLIYDVESKLTLFMAALPSVFIALCYNGKRGYGLKWFFYWAYPVHLMALFFIWSFFLRTNQLII